MPVLSCAIYVKSRLCWSKSWGQSALWDNSTVRSTLQIWSCLRSCVDSTAAIKYHWGEILGITCWSRLTGQLYINFCAVESSIRYQHRMPSTHSRNSGKIYRTKTGSLHIQCCVQLSIYSKSIYAYTSLSYLSWAGIEWSFLCYSRLCVQSWSRVNSVLTTSCVDHTGRITFVFNAWLFLIKSWPDVDSTVKRRKLLAQKHSKNFPRSVHIMQPANCATDIVQPWTNIFNKKYHE